MNRSFIVSLTLAATMAACGQEPATKAAPPANVDGTILAVHATQVGATIDATGTARPITEATLSTKLMATVTEVRVREGDRVRAGEVLARLDARDLTARGAQVNASLVAAQAMQQEAETHAIRMRSLYAQEAAPKAQLDAAEAGLARANAAVLGARAGEAELSAVRDYSQIRAPFDGVITQRFVDPGAFAAPGAPLITVQDTRRLRIEVTAAPDAVRNLKRGDAVAVRIENVPATGIVEGSVPAIGSVYRLNVIVANTQGQFLPGSAATVSLPAGLRTATLIPAAALRREGDLTGVLVSAPNGPELRWVRVGRQVGEQYEVLAGLQDGEKIIVPARLAGAR